MALEHEAVELSKVRVVILAGAYRIKGDIAITPGSRITDYMVDGKPFFAVTDAEVWDLDGRKILSGKFFNVARSQVVVVMPER